MQIQIDKSDVLSRYRYVDGAEDEKFQNIFIDTMS